jgi:hypothetical protein
VVEKQVIFIPESEEIFIIEREKEDPDEEFKEFESYILEVKSKN